MILVDTSVWIDHLHKHNATLAACLERNDVITHPMIIGELALGSLARRQEVLALLGNLPRSPSASDDEVIAFIEADALWSRGLSLVDAHLLAAMRLMPGARLWTRDKRLRAAAIDLGVSHETTTKD